MPLFFFLLMMKLSDYQNFISEKQTPLRYIPAGFVLERWEDVQPFFQDLQNREVLSREDSLRWLADRSELNGLLEEDMAWRYIKMTCDTADELAGRRFSFFVDEIQPRISLFDNQLDKKMLHLPFLDQIREKGLDIYLKNVKQQIEIFREENIPLQTEEQNKAKEYSNISGAMGIEWEGSELTMPQAGVLLQSTDREKRKAAFEKMGQRRLQDAEALEQLFSRLAEIRQKMAENAGFNNYRDYAFVSMHRHDYSVADCKNFHTAVEKCVVPLVQNLTVKRRQQLGLETLKPYDLAVEENGKPPLKAFESGKDLLEKGKEVFGRLNPFLGDCLSAMDRVGHFDLESRKGKAPGGYNYPLDLCGFPFIFMNASSTLRDMVTLMHEGGHAVHSIVTRFLPFNFLKHTPSEVAELASMSMELMSMDHWDVYFSDPEELKRAKKEHLSQVIDTLPWVATIDAFQQWIYENPNHSPEERTRAWLRISERFSSGQIDYSGYEKFREIQWHKQLHLFEVPFYYIEYGMAQLGAIALWRNFKKNPEKALADYLAALSLGHTAGIREVYETAGVKFDFSESYIRELMDFVGREMDAL
jgi:oligoendopeptidase F